MCPGLSRVRGRWGTATQPALDVRGHGNVPTGGHVEVPGSGQVEIPGPLFVVSSRSFGPWAVTVIFPVSHLVR